MGVSLLAAAEIQSNETRVVAKGPFENKKYGMSVLLIRRGSIHKEIVSVDYGYFETSDKAIEFGDKLVEEIKGLDLSKT